MTDSERKEIMALAGADTLQMLPKEALIASIKYLAEKLLAMDVTVSDLKYVMTWMDKQTLVELRADPDGARIFALIAKEES